MLHGMDSKAASAEELRAWLDDAHRHTLHSIAGLSEEQLHNPKLPFVNSFLWMVGHAAWFSERWVLRHLRGQPPLKPEADGWYDSFAVPWDVRWELKLPDRAETLAYLGAVHEAALSGLNGGGLDARSTYFYRLAVFHEDMHREANIYFRQTHAFPAPPPVLEPGVTAGAPGVAPQAGGEMPGVPLPGDVEIPGSPAYALGGTRDQPFVFDNEKWAHPVAVKPFRIARAPVTNQQFLKFVEAGGYGDASHWSLGGQPRRVEAKAEHPAYWRRGAEGGWQQRRFDEWKPLAPHQPVIYVNVFEAEAYCHWAGRRLPSEAEWELAASAEPDGRGGIAPTKRRFPWGDDPPTPGRANLNGWHAGHADGGCLNVGALPAGDSAFGCRQMLGNVWEWTADPFYPFPGFELDPYREYSAPWFGSHHVLRGGAWMTSARLIRNSWRNFFRPQRHDIPAGFRTCAL
jgi:iron(II)-dependent oxidoreductase